MKIGQTSYLFDTVFDKIPTRFCFYLARKMENIELCLLTLEDKPALVSFLRTHMPHDGTPLTSNLRLPNTEIDFIAYHMTEDAYVPADKICSFLALDKITKSIIACNLCAVCERSTDHPVDQKIDIEASEKFRSLIDFNRLMWSGVEEFIPLGYTGPYLRLDLGLVDPQYRRLGLWKKLMVPTLEKAYKEFGCKYTIAHCTSYKSQRYCDDEGWKTLRWINYNDYFVLGKRVFDFSEEPEQKCAKLMMLDNESWLRGKIL